MKREELVNNLSKMFEDEVQEAESYEEAVEVFMEVSIGFIADNSDIDLDTDKGMDEAMEIANKAMGC